jgi:hypothetical protein
VDAIICCLRFGAEENHNLLCNLPHHRLLRLHLVDLGRVLDVLGAASILERPWKQGLGFRV